MKIAVLLTLFLTGCSALPTLPTWKGDASLRRFSAEEIRSEVHRYSPSATVELSDSAFTTVSHAWALELVSWSRSAIEVMAYRSPDGSLYESQTFDCDKFAKAFSLAAELSAARNISGAQVLVGRIYVWQVFAFGGVPEGGAHALNFFVSDRGIYVVEPQSGEVCPLADYPNRDGITAVKLGG